MSRRNTDGRNGRQSGSHRPVGGDAGDPRKYSLLPGIFTLTRKGQRGSDAPDERESQPQQQPSYAPRYLQTILLALNISRDVPRSLLPSTRGEPIFTTYQHSLETNRNSPPAQPSVSLYLIACDTNSIQTRELHIFQFAF